MNGKRNPFDDAQMEKFENCRVEVMKTMQSQMPQAHSPDVLAALAYTLGIAIGKLAPNVDLAMHATEGLMPILHNSVLIGAVDRMKADLKPKAAQA